MDRKYWVPALERAHSVLRCIAEQPSSLRLMDLTAQTGINKSSMFSLLHTMEQLGWVIRERGDTYGLGPVFAYLGNAYFTSFDLVKLFMEEAAQSVQLIGETMQLARLEQGDAVYLAKKEAPTPVRLISEPGMRIPAYATALGKMLLSPISEEEIYSLYRHPASTGSDAEVVSFQRFTEHTVRSFEQLFADLAQIRQRGYAIDLEESVIGFCCVAAPIYERNGLIAASASFSIPIHHWDKKKNAAKAEILRLTQLLSGMYT